MSNNSRSSSTPALTNGSSGGAILSAGIGSFALAILTVVGDKSTHIKSMLIFYRPTGPLSGVTTAALLIWLFTWAILEWRWGKKTVTLSRVNIIAFVLLGLSFLLTFPPIVNHF